MNSPNPIRTKIHTLTQLPYYNASPPARASQSRSLPRDPQRDARQRTRERVDRSSRRSSRKLPAPLRAQLRGLSARADRGLRIKRRAPADRGVRGRGGSHESAAPRCAGAEPAAELITPRRPVAALNTKYLNTSDRIGASGGLHGPAHGRRASRPSIALAARRSRLLGMMSAARGHRPDPAAQARLPRPGLATFWFWEGLGC